MNFSSCFALPAGRAAARVLTVAAALVTAGCVTLPETPRLPDFGELAAGLTAPSGREGPPAELPRYRVGQAFVYSNGRVEQVVSIDGSAVTWRDHRGREWVEPANFVLPRERADRSIRGDAEDFWPLRTGNYARFSEVRRDGPRLFECRAEDYGPMTVPAGTFDAYRISCTRYTQTQSRISRRWVFHYAPEVGHIIAQTIMVPGEEQSSRELVAVLAPGEATPDRIESIRDSL